MKLILTSEADYAAKWGNVTSTSDLPDALYVSHVPMLSNEAAFLKSDCADLTPYRTHARRRRPIARPRPPIALPTTATLRTADTGRQSPRMASTRRRASGTAAPSLSIQVQTVCVRQPARSNGSLAAIDSASSRLRAATKYIPLASMIGSGSADRGRPMGAGACRFSGPGCQQDAAILQIKLELQMLPHQLLPLGCAEVVLVRRPHEDREQGRHGPSAPGSDPC